MRFIFITQSSARSIWRCKRLLAWGPMKFAKGVSLQTTARSYQIILVSSTSWRTAQSASAPSANPSRIGGGMIRAWKISWTNWRRVSLSRRWSRAKLRWRRTLLSARRVRNLSKTARSYRGTWTESAKPISKIWIPLRIAAPSNNIAGMRIIRLKVTSSEWSCLRLRRPRPP